MSFPSAPFSTSSSPAIKFFTATGNLLADAQTLQTYNPHRPRVLNRRIDPDLEIITMKALRPDRADRYRTVSALKADLERFQRGELISAKPVHAGELLKKLILRHKAVAMVSTAAVLILALGLGLAAWNNNDRRIEAENARRIAEKARLEAEAGRAEAMAARQLAEQQKEASDRALAELELARKAEQQAIGLHQKAVAEAHQYSQEKEQAVAEREKLARLAQTQADELKKTQQRLEQIRSRTSTEDKFADQRVEDARRSMEAALTSYQFEFSPKGLEEFTTATSLLKRISDVQQQLAGVLEMAPDFVPALMLKARLHLGALELDPARLTLRRAAQAALARPGQPGAEDIATLTQILADAGSAPSPENLASALRDTGNPLDRPAANLLETLHARVSSRRSGLAAAGQFGRVATAEEIACDLRLANPECGPIKASRDAEGVLAIEIPEASGTIDLSPLHGLEVRTLRIHGAIDLDWATLHSLPVTVLDLGKCGIQGLGSSLQNRGLQHVRTLSVAGTKIADLREIAQLPMLEELDISDTPIRNLMPLSGRRLQQLNLAGCAASPLSVLDWMPLQSLTLTPRLLPDLKANPRLRTSRTLRSIRAPGDGEQQTAADFWRRLDAGDYDKPDAH